MGTRYDELTCSYMHATRSRMLVTIEKENLGEKDVCIKEKINVGNIIIISLMCI